VASFLPQTPCPGERHVELTEWEAGWHQSRCGCYREVGNIVLKGGKQVGPLRRNLGFDDGKVTEKSWFKYVNMELIFACHRVLLGACIAYGETRNAVRGWGVSWETVACERTVLKVCLQQTVVMVRSGLNCQKWDCGLYSARHWCFCNKILLFISPGHIVFFTVHSALFYLLSVWSDFSYKLCTPDEGWRPLNV